MDKFLQDFKNNLESQTPPDFEHQDWEDMQQRLTVLTSTRKDIGRYLMWLAAALFLFSLGFNWFIFEKFKEVNNQISNLKYQKDTIIQNKVIYHADTIYQTNTIYIKEKPIESTNLITSPTAWPLSHSFSNTNRVFYQPSSLFDGNKSYFSLFPEDYNLYNQYPQQQKTSFFSNSLKVINNQNPYDKLNQNANATATATATEIVLDSINFLTTITLFPLRFTEHYLPPLTTQKITKPKRKSLRQKLYPLRPKAIAIGASSSVGMTPFDGYSDFHVFNNGLSGQVKFSDALRLTGSANLSSLNYQSEEMNEEYGVPIIAPPIDNAKLEEIKINRKMWSADIGMEYSFFTKKVLQPFIEAGFGVSSLTKNEVIYEFEEEITDEHFFEKRNYEKAKNLQYTLFKVGIDYRFGQRWRMRLSANYLHQLQSFNNQVPDNLNLGLSAFYGF